MDMSLDDMPLSNPTGSRFLSGFDESNVELPPDGLNGDCVVRYEGDHSNCEMRVRLSNGIRDGMGTIVKDGVPFIQIEYHQGVAHGPVYRMDEHGVIELRGALVDGVECGLFEEYDDSKRVV